jgi:hypothetical protein
MPRKIKARLWNGYFPLRNNSVINIANASGILTSKILQSLIPDKTMETVIKEVIDKMMPLIFLGKKVYGLNNL